MSKFLDKKDKLNSEGKDLVVRGLKFKADVTKDQFIQINKTCGCVFLVANIYKDWKDKYYYNYKYNLNMGEFKYYLTHIIKKSEEYSFLKEVDKFSLETAIEAMDNAYTRFFKKESGYPKFKNKHKDKRSYTTKYTNGNIKLEKINNNLYLQLPKLGKVKLHNMKNKLIGKILKGTANITNVTVKIRNKDIYISIQTEKIIDLISKIKTVDKSKIAAGDLGISTLLDLYSNNSHIKIDNNKYLNKSLDKLRTEQKRLSKMQNGSKNYLKQKEKINKLHFKISNQKKDYLHKLSRTIANENQVYISEDLKIVNMVKNKRLARYILDAGWGMLDNFIQYKIEANGGYFIKVNTFYPSSKLCSCGYKNIDLKLSDRRWTCPQCKKVHDRDSNASENLFNEGIKILNNKRILVV